MLTLSLILALAFAATVALVLAVLEPDPPVHRPMRAKLAVFGALVAVVLYAGGAIAADVDVKPATPDVAKQLVLHAAGIAVFIRAVIALLKSPFLGVIWGRSPSPPAWPPSSSSARSRLPSTTSLSALRSSTPSSAPSWASSASSAATR